MDKESKKKFVKSYINSAQRRIEYAQIALLKKDFPYVIRECQLIAELSAKALIIRFGFVVPKTHNLTEEILEISDLLSESFQKNVNSHIKLLKKLRKEREVALYGDSEEKIIPDELYTEPETQKIFKLTQDFYSLCENELIVFLQD